MFTGIITGIAIVNAIKKSKKKHTIYIKLPLHLSHNLILGSSVSCNGCCLTINYIDNDLISCDIVKETLNMTNLGELQIGEKINFERAARYGEEIGGHLTSGHIVGIAEIFRIFQSYNQHTIWLKILNKKILKYIFHKGFICLDGISLTIGDVRDHRFCVNIAPHTLLSTTLKNKIRGDTVNLEIDFYTYISVHTIERIMIKKRALSSLLS